MWSGRILGARASGGMRHLGFGGKQKQLGIVEEQLILLIEVAGGGLLIVHRVIRLAVEKLAVEVEPACDAGGQERLAVDAGAANPVRRHQARQAERLPQHRRWHVAEVRCAAALIEALIVLERGAALFERGMHPSESKRTPPR